MTKHLKAMGVLHIYICRQQFTTIHDATGRELSNANIALLQRLLLDTKLLRKVAQEVLPTHQVYVFFVPKAIVAQTMIAG